MRFCTWCAPAAPGGCCRGSSRRGRRCSGTSSGGARTAAWTGCTTRCATSCDADGRDPMASAAIVDAQSVKGADTVGRATRGYDGGKKVNGRKRHIVVDTLGLLLVVLVTAASVQDRDGGARVLDRLRFRMPSVAVIWADGGYAGRLLGYARQLLKVTVDIVRKREGQRTFEVLPRRWVVERTLSWISRCRRLAHERAAARALRSHGEVGDGRPDGPPAGSRPRAAPVGARQSS